MVNLWIWLIYPLVMTNIANWKDPPLWMGKIHYFHGLIFHSFLTNYQRVTRDFVGGCGLQNRSVQGGTRPTFPPVGWSIAGSPQQPVDLRWQYNVPKRALYFPTKTPIDSDDFRWHEESRSFSGGCLFLASKWTFFLEERCALFHDLVNETRKHVFVLIPDFLAASILEGSNQQFRFSAFLMAKSTISMATFNSYFHITRG